MEKVCVELEKEEKRRWGGRDEGWRLCLKT